MPSPIEIISSAEYVTKTFQALFEGLKAAIGMSHSVEANMALLDVQQKLLEHQTAELRLVEEYKRVVEGLWCLWTGFMWYGFLALATCGMNDGDSITTTGNHVVVPLQAGNPHMPVKAERHLFALDNVAPRAQYERRNQYGRDCYVPFHHSTHLV